MKKWIASAALLIFTMAPLLVSAGAPLDTINSNVSSVIDVMRDPKLKGEAGKKVKEQKIIDAAEKLFDFVELSKRTLGLNWNKLTPEQRKEFVDLYKTILKDAYIDKLTAYTDEKINYTKEVPLSETIVEVQSIVTTKKADVPIYYRVIKKEGGWKVFDVIVEGVSLIGNYRTQFREILGNNPPSTLLDTLRKKVGKK
ncbi:MAG TPA: ABC transporter substrate-binding protein [Syntrophorhabdaceae bacterium]|nr:ABC transporter substrate-binding protein [Syntrophorhabdaceae bacterium]HNT68225.1 ABC transporter substrate-binding protein [Syntrophorhabdaceae bacterium]